MLKNIVLVGFMGTGKSVVGKTLARSLGYEFLDTDTLVEKEAGHSIPDIFRRFGEAQFRKIEGRVIRQIAGRSGIVLATGGGAVLDPENLKTLRETGFIIGLSARPETILPRLGPKEERPLLNTENPLGEIQRLLEERLPAYRQADYTIDTDDLSVKQVVKSIQGWLATRHSDRITVALPQDAYDIEIGWGHLDQIGKRLRMLAVGKRLAVVTNPLVRRLHGAKVLRSLREEGFAPLLIPIPDGERYKTIQWVGKIHDELILHRFERGDGLIALGGGVIGDMTGFAAATYLRGVSYVQVPTTLAAQVDSSIGGKTGVNHPLGKNLIGAFHQPRLVWSDAKTLKTLDRRNFLSGLAEVIKYGVISDEEFFGYLEEHLPDIVALSPHHLITAIRRSSEIKAQVVAQDEREGDQRRILNYGHTLGHALEAVTGYRKYLHGEAISIGMVYAARLAHHLDLCDAETVERQKNLLARAGLPIAMPRKSPQALIKAMFRDKKVREGRIHFVLAGRIGHVQMLGVGEKDIRKLL